MMGRQRGDQDRLFYDISLDQLVPTDHLVRRIDAVLDLSWLHRELAPYYSHTGRPSVDPELMMRMLIAGYVFAIRSERQLCSEVQVNLAYRWFCGLGLEDGVPDHSVFSRARHERFRESEAFRKVFESVVGSCLKEGLVGGQSFSVDASFIKADVNQMKRVTNHPLHIAFIVALARTAIAVLEKVMGLKPTERPCPLMNYSRVLRSIAT